MLRWFNPNILNPYQENASLATKSPNPYTTQPIARDVDKLRVGFASRSPPPEQTQKSRPHLEPGPARIFWLGFRVSGLGFRVWGLGFRVSGFKF